MVWRRAACSHREPTVHLNVGQDCRDQEGCAMNTPATLLSVRNLTMRFGGLTAIDDLAGVPARQDHPASSSF